MPRPVSPDDVAVRAYELPLLEEAPYDAVVVMDGPETGPFHIYPQNLVSGSVGRTTSRLGPPPPGSEVYIQPPTGFAHWYPVSEINGAASQFYLGPVPSLPFTLPDGSPIPTGATVYLTTEGQVYVRASTGEWERFGELNPASTRVYVYHILSSSVQLPPGGAGSADDLGNVLEFDTARGDAVSVYINGAKQVGGADYLLLTNHLISVPVPMISGNIVEVVVQVKPEIDFLAYPYLIATDLWVFDGVEMVFPLESPPGVVVNPVSPAACLVSIGNRMLDPGSEFTISAGRITLAEPPGAGAAAWMVVWQLDPQLRSSRVEAFDFALVAADRGQVITVASDEPVMVACPSADTLGEGFYVDIVADGDTVTVNGPGATDFPIATGNIGRVQTFNGKIGCTLRAMTIIS